jgi:signal transduction histidine kinase/DNA-binding response OmpR family regulator
MIDPETGLVKKKFFKTDGLNNNRINAIEQDKNDGIWILTPEGLSRINTQKGIISAYSKENNLYTHNTDLLTHEDEVLVSAELPGFYKFKATDIKTNPVPPPVHIISVKINGNSVDDAMLNNEMLKLNHNESSIEFEFTALNYLSPEKNRYKYKLDGFDNAWKTTGADKRFATYTNLSPGDYAFRVLGSNNNGVWNQPGDTFEFTILPPWWKSPWAILMFTLIFTGLLALIMKVRQDRNNLLANVQLAKEQVKLQREAENLKLKYFTDISHEFRTPLTLISIPVNALSEETSLTNEHKEKLRLAKRNIARLQRLVNQFLDYRKLENKKELVSRTPVNIVEFLRSIYELFKPHCEKNSIEYGFHVNKEEFVCLFDTEKLDTIGYNLLYNAYKNTPPKGEILVDVSIAPNLEKTNGHHLLDIEIRNTGKGIEKEYLDKIFERFYQPPGSTEGLKGTGIGLSIVKEYVAFLGGTINVESGPDRYTSFKLTFPVQEPSMEKDREPLEKQTGYSDAELEEDMFPPTTGETEQAQGGGISDKKLLLIVEDNKDLRHMLDNLFTGEYEVLMAENGKIGYDKAVSQVPDIILSDVMMPEMDGFELSEKCKNHEATSHVPIVLLTARADARSKIQGMDTWADAYVSKPFDHLVLKAQLKNLIENRERLKIKYAGKNELSIHNDSTNHNDISFIGKINKIIEKNMDDENFGIKTMSKELGMSIRQLQRKFKGFIDVSPSEYVRTYRLNKAANMLAKDKETSISDVAYAVGFKHPTNFTAAFRKHFGKPPTDYIN